MRAWSVALVLLVGCNLGPTVPRVRVELEPDRLAFYYLEFEKRANLWFCGERVPGRACPSMPEIPSLEELEPTIYFEEVAWGETCYFKPKTGRIEIPADKWESGCVPHELGHAALHYIDHPCASIFEHPPNGRRAPEKCR